MAKIQLKTCYAYGVLKLRSENTQIISVWHICTFFLNMKAFSKLHHVFMAPQVGKDSYNPCYIWDLDYSNAELSGHNNVSKLCTHWQFDSAEVGETIIEKVSCYNDTKYVNKNINGRFVCPSALFVSNIIEWISIKFGMGSLHQTLCSQFLVGPSPDHQATPCHLILIHGMS